MNSIDETMAWYFIRLQTLIYTNILWELVSAIQLLRFMRPIIMVWHDNNYVIILTCNLYVAVFIIYFILFLFFTSVSTHVMHMNHEIFMLILEIEIVLLSNCSNWTK